MTVNVIKCSSKLMTWSGKIFSMMSRNAHKTLFFWFAKLKSIFYQKLLRFIKGPKVDYQIITNNWFRKTKKKIQSFLDTCPPDLRMACNFIQRPSLIVCGVKNMCCRSIKNFPRLTKNLIEIFQTKVFRCCCGAEWRVEILVESNNWSYI